MWQRKTLQLSPALSGLSASIVPVHPFLYGVGQQADSGSYLSPANALHYLSNKLTGAGHLNALVLMVCAKTHTEFMQHLTQFSSVLPLPQPLSTASSRLTANAHLIAQAKAQASAGSSLAGLKSQLNGFTTARQNALQQVGDALNGAMGNTAAVWAFSGTGNGALLAEKMRKGIPEPDAVYTLGTLFVADDISPLERMLSHEPDYHPRP